MKDRIFSNVFNLPLVRTLSEYNSIGNNNKDRVLYDVLHEIEENSKNIEKNDQARQISLKFDACRITGKNVLNM